MPATRRDLESLEKHMDEMEARLLCEIVDLKNHGRVLLEDVHHKLDLILEGLQPTREQLVNHEQ